VNGRDHKNHQNTSGQVVAQIYRRVLPQEHRADRDHDHVEEERGPFEAQQIPSESVRYILVEENRELFRVSRTCLKIV
jgi:hypothetical protein